MIKHEAICYSNPIRSCLRCQVEKTNVVSNSLILGLKGIEGVDGHVDHCPDCVLAAVILSNKSCSRDPEDGDKWIQYDYKKAREEWDLERRDELASLVIPHYPI